MGLRSLCPCVESSVREGPARADKQHNQADGEDNADDTDRRGGGE